MSEPKSDTTPPPSRWPYRLAFTQLSGIGFGLATGASLAQHGIGYLLIVLAAVTCASASMVFCFLGYAR